MGLKGAGPYFQRSIQNKVLNGLVYEIYIDECSSTFNPRKTKLGLKEVEYVGHLVSATGTSFTPEKRLKVLNFPQPSILQFIDLVNYFRDHVTNGKV